MTQDAKRLAQVEKQNLRLLKVIRKAFQQAESYRIHAAIRTLGSALNKYEPRIDGPKLYQIEESAFQSEVLHCTNLKVSNKKQCQ